MNIKGSAKEEKKSTFWREQEGKGNPPSPDVQENGMTDDRVRLTLCPAEVSYVCLCHHPHPAPGLALIIWTPDWLRRETGPLDGVPVGSQRRLY